MQKQNPMLTGQTGQLMRPLPEQDRIDSALKTMAIRLDKVLSESVISQWHADLGSYPIAAIEYAADWCGKNLERWPKWKQFTHAIGTWMQEREQASGQDFAPTAREIAKQRKAFYEWYNSPEAAEVRGMISALDKKMNSGKKRFYTQEELDRFKAAKKAK
jgi:hypothetical protein